MSRELDSLVAEKVMGWTFEAAPTASRDGDFWSDGEKYITGVDFFCPSTSIKDAWLVVEKMKADGYTLELDDRPAGWAACFIRYASEHRLIAQMQAQTVIDESAPMALVLAALGGGR